MTVSEFIEKLKKLPPHLPIVMYDELGACNPFAAESERHVYGEEPTKWVEIYAGGDFYFSELVRG